MTRFRQGQDVAVVEHDDATRKPREGGKTHWATIAGAEGAYFQVRYDDPAVFAGRLDTFWQESGWRAWDGLFRWRLVSLCHRCQEPVTGEPVTDEGDPLGREWCSDECHDEHGEAWADQHYPSGVAT